jgi:hypothetical protein
MRKAYIFFAFAFAMFVQSPAAIAASTYKEFGQAWAQRDARYVEEHGRLDKVAREATAHFLKAPASPAALEAMMTSIKAASYADGRGNMLRDLRIAMDSKPSSAGIEMWLQERIDGVRRETEVVQAKFDGVRSIDPNTDRYLEEVVAAVVMSATLRGKAEELRLLEQNLSSYLRAQGEEDIQRREARARVLGAIGAALSQPAFAMPPVQPRRTTNCQTYGALTQCQAPKGLRTGALATSAALAGRANVPIVPNVLGDAAGVRGFRAPHR